MLRNYLLCLSLIMCASVCPWSGLQAGDAGPDDAAIIDRAIELRELLEHLLLDANDSSIQKIIKEGDEPTKALIAKALEMKSQGEQLLAEKKYLAAAVSLQSSLDYVFKAIRQGNEQEGPPEMLQAKLQEHVKVNDTFISTATRVVTDEQNQDALKLLEMAKAARSRADAETGDGKSEAALLELEQ